jgi:hypothetical protein
LLAEHVKYESYVDSLEAAMTLRFKKRGEKALEHALRADAANPGSSSGKGKHKGRAKPRTIPESEESTPVIVSSSLSPTVRHRREQAQVDGYDCDT